MTPRLDKRIRIERNSYTQDATYGAAVPTWVLVTKAWAELQDALPSRSEAVRNGLAQARNQTRCRIRYREGIDSTMRVVWNGIYYQIVGGPAEILGRKAYLELMLERYSTTGGGA